MSSYILHNCIQKDRYKPTNYAEEKSMLYTKRNGAYTFDASKNFSGVNAIRSAGCSPVKEVEACIPSLAEVADYCRKRKNGVSAESFIDYYKSIGWKRNGEIITDWIQRFVDRFNKKAECIMDDYATWEDQIQILKEECGLDFKIRRNDTDVKVR